MKKNKIMFCAAVLAVCCAFCQSPTPAFAQTFDAPSSAKAMCVLEQSTGRVLFEKNAHKPLAMASTTKVFTALTVLENCTNLEEMVHIDDRAVGIEGTSIYLRKNEVLSVKELLLGMMLPSGNDAATALAYHIGGDIPTFCQMMQKTAQNAGASSSQFKNPHGLDEAGHFTTAYDLALVSAKALENPDFYEISTTKSAVISGNSEVKSRFLKNKNRLLKSFDGCNGVKTGFTDNAGRCFVSSAKRGEMNVVCAVLNCGDMFEECARLMEKSFQTYRLVPLVESYDILGEIEVKHGRRNNVRLFSRQKFSYPLTEEERLRVNVVLDVPQTLQAPIRQEQIVGKISIYLENHLLFEDDVLTRHAVKSNNIFSFVGDVAKFW